MHPAKGLVVAKQRSELSENHRVSGFRRRDSAKEKFSRVLSGIQARGKSSQNISQTSISRGGGKSPESPTTTIFEHSATASKSSHELISVSDGLSLPERPILFVDLQIIPEVASVDVEDERSIWVAVQVCGKVKLAEEPPPAALDIVIIVDNSAYASDDCLESACQLVLYIARLLTNLEDRIAIFLTSYQHPNNGTVTGGQLSPLQPIDMAAITAGLGLVKTSRSASAPQDMDLSETLVAAFRTLKGRSTRSERSHTSGHVVLLSPNPAKCCGGLGSIAPFPVHVIIPAIVPWNSKPELNNGWRLSLSCPPKEPGTILQDIKQFIDHGRTMTNTGQVRNLHIIIASCGSECRIEKLLGQTVYPVLQPGQAESVLVKVSIPPWNGRAFKTVESSNRRNQIDTLLADLEGLLGDSHSELFTVTVDYNHSLFPPETFLTIHGTCRLRRSNQASVWSIDPIRELPEHAASIELHAYTQLMRTISHVLPPSSALAALSLLFAKSNYGLDVNAYLDLVRAELEYQASTISRFRIETMNAPAENTASLSILLKENECPVSEILIKDGIRHASTSSCSSASVIHYVGETGQSDDAAHRIWRLMRRDSRSKNSAKGESSESLSKAALLDQRVADIRADALLNKRSIGIDSLRSLSLGSATQVGQKSVAPWL